MWVKQTVGEQRRRLVQLIEPPLQNLAKQCISVWSDIDALDTALQQHLDAVPHNQLLYAIDKLGKQISSNVTPQGISTHYRGQDLSRRPYSVSLYPKRHFLLSSVYISQTTGRPSVSAVQPVISEQQFLGFIVADFDIRHVPIELSSTPLHRAETLHHDEALQRAMSSQSVVPIQRSLIDMKLPNIIERLQQLMSGHGVFHVTIYYANSQILLWSLSDPYQYQLHQPEQLLSEEVLEHYPAGGYPDNAAIAITQVGQILQRFQLLRQQQNLCSSSLNIMNGMVGVRFSGDDSEYMSASRFLDHEGGVLEVVGA